MILKTLAEELLSYEVEVSSDANDRYGSFKVGSRDDLVTALGLAVTHEPGMRSGIGVVALGDSETSSWTPSLGQPFRVIL